MNFEYCILLLIVYWIWCVLYADDMHHLPVDK